MVKNGHEENGRFVSEPEEILATVADENIQVANFHNKDTYKIVIENNTDLPAMAFITAGKDMSGEGISWVGCIISQTDSIESSLNDSKRFVVTNEEAHSEQVDPESSDQSSFIVMKVIALAADKIGKKMTIHKKPTLNTQHSQSQPVADSESTKNSYRSTLPTTARESSHYEDKPSEARDSSYPARTIAGDTDTDTDTDTDKNLPRELINNIFEKNENWIAIAHHPQIYKRAIKIQVNSSQETDKVSNIPISKLELGHFANLRYRHALGELTKLIAKHPDGVTFHD